MFVEIANHVVTVHTNSKSSLPRRVRKASPKSLVANGWGRTLGFVVVWKELQKLVVKHVVIARSFHRFHH